MAEARANQAGDDRGNAMKWAAVAVAIIVAAAIIAVLALGGGEKNADKAAGATEPTAAYKIVAGSDGEIKELANKLGCTYSRPKVEGSSHKPDSFDFKYTTNPPTSGTHSENTPNDGAYLENPPPVQQLLHSLEHGRVIYQWDPKKIAKEQIGSLEHLYEDEPTRLIIAPNETGMPFAIAATAWGHLLGCDEIKFPETYELLRTFHATWQDRGPEKVPPMQ